MSGIEKFILEFSNEFDQFLLSLIPKKYFSNKLNKAMEYTIKVGGKRLRPIFLIEISKILGVKKLSSYRAAAAIEFIHCYSLVHDDLPAMDNDDLRRGHMTCHKKFDDATAILVGDAFQSLAFEILSDKKTHPDTEIRCSLINELSRASGAKGMVGGQMLDLEAEKKKLSLDEILLLQKLKTGELFRFSCMAGPILSDYRDKRLFDNFARNLGLAFQIKDDLLDIEGDEKEMGKKTRKDFSRGKETLITFFGKKNAEKKSEELIRKSKQLLKTFGKKADRVANLTDFVISRNK
ncbi:MAG: farnesyl diphosphate synthase [Pseudomonadota bacterium]|nr:farnesyl diphosphate synthase [Pseudomonadota bacterium]